MATSAMSSLGLGSGVLTYDVIDKLKKADEESYVAPIDKKIATSSEKKSELALLMTSIGTIKSYTSKLSDTSTYLARKATVSGDGVKATAGTGLVIQDIKVQVKQLAKSDVYEVGMKYASRDSSFSAYNTNIAMYKEGSGDVTINVAANTALSEVGQAITDATNGSAAGVIMKTGGENPYQLMINSSKTGLENKLYMGSTMKTSSVVAGEIGEGTFTFGYRDAQGVDREVSITIGADDSTNSSSATDNATMIRDKLRAALYDSASSSNLIFMESDTYTSSQRNAPIHIDLGSDGKSLVLNDMRGSAITLKADVVMQDSGLLGGEASKSTHAMNILDTGSIMAGSLSGKFYVGSTLVTINPTNASNSAKQNAEEIIAQINAIKPDGFTAELNSTKNGFTLAKRVSGSSEAALTSVGLKAGVLDGTVKSSGVSAGQLNGTLTIAGVDIDLSSITNAANSADDNASAIAAALNGQSGLSVSASGSSFTVVNTNRSTGIYKYDDGSAGTSQEEEDSAKLLSNLKIKAGSYKSYADLFQFENSGSSKIDNIQPAQDAVLYYNDIKITRSGNRIDDIVSGLTLELSKTHSMSSGESATVRVEQDLGSLIEDIKSFVSSYNELTTKLAKLTKYDPDTKVAGLFQGESQIYGIKSSLNTLLSYSDGQNRSLIAYGIYLNDDGTLQIDDDKLNKKVFEDTDATEAFFRGYVSTSNGKETEVDGVFKKFTDKIDALVTGSNSMLKLYETKLEGEYKRLEKQKKSFSDMLESKYEIMAARFAAYDTIIAGLNNSFQSLQAQIDAANNG